MRKVYSELRRIGGQIKAERAITRSTHGRARSGLIDRTHWSGLCGQAHAIAYRREPARFFPRLFSLRFFPSEWTPKTENVSTDPVLCRSFLPFNFVFFS
ncbi:hypothetical protein GWI33_001281 [Rhynchophorus ferrugineus]|nr:hypothetical protein GWI33_001281 [Rhynchophorus ferrugineus]